MPPQSSSPLRGLILAVLCTAQCMLILDVAVVNVALPPLQTDLRIQPADLAWVSTAYTLVFGGCLLVAGRAGDLFGRRRLFVGGVLFFTLASLLCGLAQSSNQIFVARALQGLGAATVAPAALALLMAIFPEGDERNRALGTWGVVASGGAVAGQLVGGALTQWLDWRWVFLVNVPVGLLTAAVALRVLPESRPTERPRLDLAGSLSVTGSLVLLVLGITQIEGRGLDPVVGATLGGALLALLLFVGIERMHPAPLVRLEIFRHRALRAGNLAAALNAGAASAVVFFTALYLQRVLGYEPFVAGLAFAPVTLVIMLVSSQSVRVIARWGVRSPLVIGSLIAATGAFSLSRVSGQGSVFAEVLPGLLLVGVGMGLAFAPSMILATSGVDAAEHGLASGLLTTAQQLGGAIGLAALATATVVVAGAAEPGLGPLHGLVRGYQAGYLLAGVLPMLGVLPVLLLPRDASTATAPAPVKELSRTMEAL